YPTLITMGTFYGLPDWFRALELVTIHEFGHQYWYGLLGSNEFEEAWLDEGITSYAEMRIMDEAYGFGSASAFPGLEINDSDMQRLSYTQNNPTRGAIFAYSWKHDFNDYGKVSYAKPATVLGTLEGYIGTERMRELMRTYYSRWRFRHPTTRDFIDVAEEVAGEDLSWFFDQFVYGTVAVDYTVNRVSSKRTDQPTADDDSTRMYLSTIVLQRKQNGVMPVDVAVRFENDETDSFVWDGRDEWKKIEYNRPVRVAEVYIDPENKVLLDLNKLNNRWVREGDSSVATKYGLKYLVWMQQFLHAFTGFL
ncbi:MAG: M1 family aminopeptidase, partial [Rhodothermia bacterium]